ncbi:hypothetical protein TCE0_015f01767 [Talaromyces pinophilus]|uniref:Uncharacterized protein n=1 Tax=Talaromyces pinophilus TaxID=128442 RepID=A0A6V8GZ21_TALPI|nr:Hypothetical protein PENO1_018460 [Penicillium occitanis (nom. inval.)]PCH07038.1 hypothetical protein PENOC_020560 [Penicillium occitanis (nom. inval.)]GAM34290.1 hypothetical protein TCE0_015f01767 [Talaromyces pinophilus]
MPGFPPSELNEGCTLPPDARVIGLVFYGRKEFVSILDLYLKRNLRVNGGLLDEVIFVVKTNKTHDLEYLDELLSQQPQYSKYIPSEGKPSGDVCVPSVPSITQDLKLDWCTDKTGPFDGWVSSWKAVVEPQSIYIKIDDDIVYIEDSTIPALCKKLVENPQYFAVSANVVNGGFTSWLHHRLGVYAPYWPETRSASATSAHEMSKIPCWRPSKLPPHTERSEGASGFCADGTTPAPFQGHRWLPLRSDPAKPRKELPNDTVIFDAWGPNTENWAVGAQTHYSFLQHLEQNTTWRYKFDTWNMDHMRLAITFLAIRGKDIIDSFPFSCDDDEYYLTCIRPKELARPVVINGTGLAAHFAFNPQRVAHDGKSIMWTDLLDRYRLVAAEIAGMVLKN